MMPASESTAIFTFLASSGSREAQRKTAAKLESETGAAEKRIAAAKAAAIANIRDVALDVARAAMQKLAGGAVDDRGTAAAVDAVLRERS